MIYKTKQLRWNHHIFCLLLSYWGRVTQICVGKLTIIGSDNGLSPPSHYLNQCWNIVNLTFRHKLKWNFNRNLCNDVIMRDMVTQITSLAIVYSTVYSGAAQRKHQISASLAFVRGIHRRYRFMHFPLTLQWRHNGCDGVSNHHPPDCLLNRLFRCSLNKTPKLRATGLWEGNSPVTGEIPAQRASNAVNGSIWWRHHDTLHNGSDMERIRKLGIPWSPVDSPHKDPMLRRFYGYFVISLISSTNSPVVGGLRRRDAHVTSFERHPQLSRDQFEMAGLISTTSSSLWNLAAAVLRL